MVVFMNCVKVEMFLDLLKFNLKIQFVKNRPKFR